MMVHNSLERPSVELHPKQTTEEHCFKKKTLFIQPPQVNIIYDYILSTQMYKTICKSIILKTPLIQPPHCYIL